MLGRVRQLDRTRTFLPQVGADPVQRRAAVASTLLAGLELARTGQADLRQEATFGPILVRAVSA